MMKEYISNPSNTNLFLETSIRYVSSSKTKGIVSARLIPRDHKIVQRTDLFLEELLEK